MVALAIMGYCSGVAIEHFPVVIFMSSREDSLMFTRSSVFPREELHCIIGLNVGDTFVIF